MLDGNTRSGCPMVHFPRPRCPERIAACGTIASHAYLGLCGEYTAGLFGHSEPRSHASITRELASGLNLAAVGAAEVQLARSILCDRFRLIELVRFTNSGTEANPRAITATRAFTSRDQVMVFRGGYHGGVLTFPLSGTSAVTVPFPVVMADYNDTARTVALIRQHATTLAAIILEPMLGGGGGCIPAHPQFLHALRDPASHDLPHVGRRAAGAGRGRARSHPAGQIHGGRHELRRLRWPS
jgi:glutamate-1-semialdehyde 2,1-aminomutase